MVPGPNDKVEQIVSHVMFDLNESFNLNTIGAEKASPLDPKCKHKSF